MSDTQAPVLTRVVGSTLVITLNRPDKRNAVDPAVTAEMSATITRLESDPKLRCGVLTGAGTAFSAGADLNYIARGESHMLETADGGLAGFVRRPRTKPVVAAVNGPALAGGCEIALACDIVIAADHAVFGLPEVQRGIAASAGGVFRFARAIPFGRVMFPLLTGEPFSAEDAAMVGLIQACIPGDTVLEAALDISRRLALAAPLAVADTLRLARSSAGMTGTAVDWENSESMRDRLGASADAVEGATAFLERRRPSWTGS